MTSERTSNSNAIAWTLSLLAVPLFYLLSVPPVMMFAPKETYDLPPAWASYYSMPYCWLYDTPLKESLREYAGWWLRVTEKE
jgi:hypothetical protein